MKNSMKSIAVTTLLLLVLFTCNISSVSGQANNHFSVTPLKAISGKVNFRYERSINSNRSIIVDAQPMKRRWNYDSGMILGSSKRKGNASGLRLSLELRNYFTPEGKKTKYFYGAGIFSGVHNLTTSSRDSSPSEKTRKSSGKDVQLISSGAYITGGLRKHIGSFFIDCSLNGGFNFIGNHTGEEADFKNHYLLRTLHGVLFEPKLAIGFSF